MSSAPICRVCNEKHWMRDPHIIKGALLADATARIKRMKNWFPAEQVQRESKPAKAKRTKKRKRKAK